MIIKIRKILKENLVLIFVLLFPVVVGYFLLKPGYFSMHDDVQVMRLYEMEKCFKDGQIPCRWVPDMGAQYGHPLFNYHPVFAYYGGMTFRIFNISFVDTAKLLFLFSLILSSLFMYLLTKEFFGKIGGLLSASMYVLAPYHAVDIFVRGALTESWALVFFPLVLWSLYKLITSYKFTYFILSVFSLCLLLISHNTMPLIFFPVAVLWSLFWIITEKNWKIIPKLCLVALWSLGLSAFFLFPSLLEIKLAKLETMASTYYVYKDHFVTLSQLFFKRDWGYGPSIFGSQDTMSFQLGWPFWILTVISGLLSLVKKNKTLAFFFFVFGFSIFMTHAKSYFLWNIIPGMSYVQFPWRFLSLSILAMAFLVGGLLAFIKSEKTKITVAFMIILITFILNFSYFQPEIYYPDMTDSAMLSGDNWKRQSMTTLNDYVPSTVKEYPKDLAPSLPWVVEGEASVSQYRKKSDFWRFTVDVVGTNNATIEVPVFEYPEWETVIEQTRVEHSYNPETGVIRINVPPGNHSVSGWFRNTPIRKTANVISLISFGSMILLMILKGQKEKND
jgi:hypothetical protein